MCVHARVLHPEVDIHSPQPQARAGCVAIDEPSRMDSWRELFRIARRQHCAVHRRQATALDISNATFTRRVRREQWPQPYRSVFRSGAPPADRERAAETASEIAGGSA
jgi:hypothetical protein